MPVPAEPVDCNFLLSATAHDLYETFVRCGYRYVPTPRPCEGFSASYHRVLLCPALENLAYA